MPDATDLDPALDRVERSIDIDATPERVWALLEQPGWWINEGDVDLVAEVRREATPRWSCTRSTASSGW